MRMDGQDESQNVDDVRGSSGGGGGFGLGGVGIGTVAVALVAGWIFGINPLTVLGFLDGRGGAPVVAQAPVNTNAARAPTNDPQVKFIRQVLRSTEVVWTDLFQHASKTYVAPRLELYSGSYPTACGQGVAAMGPFYCPGDQKVYLDLNFFDVMRTRLGAPGQFAQAYVVAHEVGHHVQNLLGITQRVETARRDDSKVQANAVSVRVELQADCFAGVWANRSQNEQGWRLEPGDIDTALHAASQIGDDTLQRQARGTVVPDSFTHGTSEQRVDWFKRGFDTGRVSACDTFKAERL